MYVWDEKTINEREAIDMKTVADATHSCIAWNGKDVFIGMTTSDLLTGVDKRIVGQCSIDDIESCKQLFTFSLEVTSVDASQNYVVAGGSDFTVKKVSLKDSGQYDRIDTFGEVLSVAIDPKEEVYAVACCDGTVSIYNIITNEKLASLEHLFTTFGDLSVEKPRHTLTWSKDGSELFVPSQGCVKVISREGWDLTHTSFKADGTTSDVFSTSCLSRCGRYLCASTLSNKIILWKVTDRSVLSQHEYKRGRNPPISSTKFCPFNDKDIVLADVEEGLCMLKNAVPSPTSETSVNKKANSAKKATEGDDSDESDDEKGDSDSDAERPEVGGFINDEAEDDGDTRMSADIGAIKKRYGFGDDGSGQLEDFGFTISNEAPSRGTPVRDVAPYSLTSAPPPQIEAYKPPTIPTFFASGASPDHLTQRYLKWNSFGVVRTYSGDDGSSIEITFHDASLHPTIVIDNGIAEYAMADLSDQAVALASKAEGRAEQSELLVIHISSWDSESKRWTTKLPPKESALDVLVSRELICVVTTKRNLRVFTLTGTQRHVISHPSPILTCACFGSQIAICSISGGDYYETGRSQKPNYQHTISVYGVDSKWWHQNAGNGVKFVSLPVARKEHLVWLGYTNHGQLVSMDSSYVVNLLAPAGFWVPIFDGSVEIANKSDAVWPIAVTEGRQRQIRYLYCKGSKHPLVAVKMTPLIAPWMLPYCAPESDKSKLEQELFLNELQQSEARSSPIPSDAMELAASHLQALVKLFALACRSERDGRAAELAGLVTSAKGIQMMCNYAAKLKKSTLADKVAAKGRENVAVNEPSFSDSFHTVANHDPILRPMSIKKKPAAVQQRPTFMEDQETYVSTTMLPLEVEHGGDDEEEQSGRGSTQPSTFTQRSDDTLLNETVLPVRNMSRNPFKRSPSSSMDTSSVFDADSSFSIARKRVREEEPCKPQSSKQQKLSFGSIKGKENARTAYSVWLEDSEESLRSMFCGNPEDFPKFCAQQFRLLPAAERKEWKARAEGDQR